MEEMKGNEADLYSYISVRLLIRVSKIQNNDRS